MTLVAAVACATCVTTSAVGAHDTSNDSIQGVVDGAIRPLMAKDKIPGVAVAVTVDGKTHFFNYGVASIRPRQPVTPETLFEIGSVSKTFTATLASWAQINGYLSLADPTAKYLPDLQGTPFGRLPLLYLGTHTPGGVPLQVPDGVTNDAQMMQYLKSWHPRYAPGTYRTYSNVGIGMLGLITAKSMGQDFGTLMQQQLFPALGLHSTFVNVPANKMPDYAEGYTSDSAPIRMSKGELWAQAYGVRSTTADLIRFVEANMNEIKLDGKLQRAIVQTHTGYFTAGPMTQDLIWEQYPYPVTLKALLAGNSPAMLLTAMPVRKIQPPEAPADNVWINKTGSTNGFGTYVAFVPAKHIGIVILANKNYSIADRVTAAYKILSSL